LTDHDTTAGWNPAEDAARIYGLGIVRGMEISCRYEGISGHLLSYLHDPYATGLAAGVQDTRRARRDRTHPLVESPGECSPVHLVSYLHDPYDTGLAAVVQETRRARLDRTHLIIERLAEDYPIDMDAVLSVSGEDATIGRPHIADALVAAGVVETRTEAFSSI